jgi:hypothetical protein
MTCACEAPGGALGIGRRLDSQPLVFDPVVMVAQLAGLAGVGVDADWRAQSTALLDPGERPAGFVVRGWALTVSAGIKGQQERWFGCPQERPIGGDAVEHSISVSKFGLGNSGDSG